MESLIFIVGNLSKLCDHTLYKGYSSSRNINSSAWQYYSSHCYRFPTDAYFRMLLLSRKFWRWHCHWSHVPQSFRQHTTLHLVSSCPFHQADQFCRLLSKHDIDDFWIVRVPFSYHRYHHHDMLLTGDLLRKNDVALQLSDCYECIALREHWVLLQLWRWVQPLSSRSWVWQYMLLDEIAYIQKYFWETSSQW